MSEGEQRIEVLEDEMKVLKGEVSRTLVDLRALLMREDSPLTGGGLRNRPSQPEPPSEPLVPISLPTPEGSDAAGAGPTAAAIDAGGGEDRVATGSPSALDGSTGSLASLTNNAITPPGAPGGAPPDGPVRQDIPGSEMVLRHEIAGNKADAEIADRRARLRELEREEEEALEERARRRKEDEKEEKAAEDRRERLRSEEQEGDAKNKQQDAHRRVSAGQELGEEPERRGRRRKQDREEDEERIRTAKRRELEYQEESAEMARRERRARQRAEDRAEDDAKERRQNRQRREEEEERAEADDGERRRSRPNWQEIEDADPPQSEGSRASRELGDDFRNYVSARLDEDDYEDDWDDEDEPRQAHHSGRLREESKEGMGRDSHARMTEEWDEGDFGTEHRYAEHESYSQADYSEYDYELDDDQGYYDDPFPDEEYMERGREQERETRRESGRVDGRGGRGNPGRRAAERDPRSSPKSARGRRDQDDHRRRPAAAQHDGYDDGDTRGYPPGDRRSGYPRYADESDVIGRDSRRRLRQPVEEPQVYRAPEYYGESGSEMRHEPRDSRRAPEPREFANGTNGAEYGVRPPQPQYSDYGWDTDANTAYGNGGYGNGGYGYGQRQYPLEPVPARVSNPAMDLNLVASLLRWASIAKHRVGDKRLGEIVELYVESRSAPPGLKEALEHITSVADEQSPESGQNTQETLDLISHLHGILTATLPVPMVPNIKGNLKIRSEFHADPRGDW